MSTEKNETNVFGSFKKVFAGYADFRGKTNPYDFYFGLVWLLVVQVIWQMSRGSIFNADGPDFESAFAKQQTVQLILNFALYLPMVAIIVRRLNDMGRSAWLAAPIGLSVMASNLDAAYGAWINPSYATHLFESGGGWFSSIGSITLVATLVSWLFTVIVTIKWGAEKQLSAAAQ